MSSRFERKTEEWTEEKLQLEFMDVRRHIMTEAPGNLLQPSEDPLVYKYAPFSRSDYPYRKHIRSLSQSPWLEILAERPEDLITLNPHAPSRFRENGYACWDAAVGIPATTSRKARIINMKDTPIIRNTNEYWSKEVAVAFQNVGPTGVPGVYRRPTGEYIVDFTQIKEGHFMLELAHSLAHKAGDDKEAHSRMATLGKPSKTAAHYLGQVAVMAVSYAFDLPMDMMPTSEGLLAQPDFPMVGLELKSSSFHETPYLRIPWSNSEAMRFDETLAVMSVGIFVQPHPYGFISGTLEARPEDRWSCQPTIAIIAGWESVDMLTHQPLIQRWAYAKGDPICYGTHPRDLMSPDSFWGYLQLWRQRRRELGLSDVPQSDARRMRPYDMLYGPMFERLIRTTPPKPCKCCQLWNKGTEGVPQRPRGEPPKDKKELALPKNWAWRLYERDTAAIFDIIERSTLAYEYKLYGPDTTKRLRKDRLRNWKGTLQLLKEAGYVVKAREKKRHGKKLTRWEQRAYNAWKLEQRKEKL